MKLKQLLLYSLLAPVALSPTLDARDPKTKTAHTKTQEDDQELELDSTDMVFIIVTALAATSVLGYIIYWKYYKAPAPKKIETPPAKKPVNEPKKEQKEPGKSDNSVSSEKTPPAKKPANEPKKEQKEPGKSDNSVSSEKSGTLLLPKFAKNINKFWKDQQKFL